MNIDLNFTLKNLDGVEMIAQSESHLVNAGKIIANHLVSGTKGSAIKYFDWATKLYKGEILVLDRQDTSELKKFIDENQNISILIKAQVLERFDLDK